jgi:CelD/BcsL family acetyltransferase involved in cellulose biosynthesis
MIAQACSTEPYVVSGVDHWSALQALAKQEPAKNAAADLDFNLITDRAAFDALELDWNELFERSGRPTQVFQTFNWNWHWANHYLSGAPGGIEGLKLSIVTGRRDGRLIMIWPLVSERVRGIRQIFWMGEPVSQYGDIIIDDVPDALDVMRAGWDFLSAHAKGDVVRLRRVRKDAAIAPLMDAIGARITDRQKAPYLDLASAPTYAKYEERYTSRARRNRRRLARRLEEQGTVAFERHYGGPEARALAMKALALKTEWLRQRGLVSHAISDARMARFFSDAAEGKDKSTNCIVSALKSDGEPAALEVSFTCKGRLALHVIVYSLKFEKSGAGVLLMEKSMSDGYLDGIGVYDMLAPGDNYKLDWADDSADVYDWVKPLSLAGFTYARLYLGLLRSRAKHAIEAMPESVRRLLTKSYALTF